MTQGLSYIPNQPISFSDTPSLDSFSRLRVSNPQGVFDAQFTYNLQPILFEQITLNAGATIAHSTTNRCALMTFASTPTGGRAYMQSYEYHRYQPGKSQLVFVTFNMVAAVANCLKFAGYSDGVNGFEFQNNGSVNQWVLYSGSGNGNQTITQANWNLDKLDGTGPSGITLDITKTQIAVISFQALYVGRVFVGFDIGGKIVFVHEFLHANVVVNPYIQTANLPVRCGMTCTGTVSTTMNFICSSVISEGGKDNQPVNSFSVVRNASAPNGSLIHIVSIRPKTTFNGLSNRTKFSVLSINLVVLNTNPSRWELSIGQAITGATYADVNTTYSSTEATNNGSGTLSGSPAVVIASGLTSSSDVSSFQQLKFRYPFTLDAAGAVRALGTVTLSAAGIGGISDFYASIFWDEER
jgi:hypothetical protein